MNTRLIQTTTSTNQSWVEESITARGIEFGVSIYNPKTDTPPPHVVLCLPGALGTGPSDFPQLLEGGLGPQFRVVAVDFRGLGASASMERDYPLDFYIRDALDAAAIMSELGHETYHVLGWSDGANSAVHLAAHEDTRQAVDRLVVWGGSAYVTQEDCEAWESIRDVNNWSTRMREEKAAVHGGVDNLQALNHVATDGWIRLYTDPTNAGDICLKALPNVSCPTLIVHGAKDTICEVHHAHYLAKHITNSKLVIFDEGKHNVHQRYADRFHEEVRAFLLT